MQEIGVKTLRLSEQDIRNKARPTTTACTTNSLKQEGLCNRQERAVETAFATGFFLVGSKLDFCHFSISPYIFTAYVNQVCLAATHRKHLCRKDICNWADSEV